MKAGRGARGRLVSGAASAGRKRKKVVRTLCLNHCRLQRQGNLQGMLRCAERVRDVADVGERVERRGIVGLHICETRDRGCNLSDRLARQQRSGCTVPGPRIARSVSACTASSADENSLRLASGTRPRPRERDLERLLPGGEAYRSSWPWTLAYMLLTLASSMF